ncbi:MAG: hypothetical protein LBS90_04490 [Oscillospiraceae bacterium]|jgi:hypothetical protein|nr:hypothetical protein [Oscillospiraceae bacterium]
MGVKSCKLCGRPFQQLTAGLKLCKYCNESTDADFEKIRSYLYENPAPKTLEDLSAVTDVKLSVIRFLLGEQRIQFGDTEKGSSLTCKVCKKPISSGIVCESCKNAFVDQIKPSALAVAIEQQKREREKQKKPVSTGKSKMHTGFDK